MFKYIILLSILTLSCASANNIDIYLQNDLLSSVSSDRYYTHGTEIRIGLDSLTNAVVTLGDRSKISIKQLIYTPGNLDTEEKIEGDRPYSGLLTLGYISFDDGESGFMRYSLEAGAIGKYSFAKETQTFVHKITNSKAPKGWDNQIRDMFAFNGNIRGQYSFKPSKYIYTSPYFEGNIGNVFIDVKSGLLLKIGHNLKEDDTSTISPVLDSDNFSFYIFIDGSAKYVEYNRFLKGTEKEDMVYDLGTGIGSRYKHLEILFGQTFRTEEFKGQDGSHRFGTLGIKTNF